MSLDNSRLKPLYLRLGLLLPKQGLSSESSNRIVMCIGRLCCGRKHKQRQERSKPWIDKMSRALYDKADRRMKAQGMGYQDNAGYTASTQ